MLVDLQVTSTPVLPKNPAESPLGRQEQMHPAAIANRILGPCTLYAVFLVDALVDVSGCRAGQSSRGWSTRNCVLLKWDGICAACCGDGGAGIGTCSLHKIYHCARPQATDLIVGTS